jgi:hypothetical protein
MSRRAPRVTKTERRAGASAEQSVASIVAELRAIERTFAPPAGASPNAYRAQVDHWREREGDAHLEYQIPETFGRVLFARICERYGLQPRRDPNDPLMIHVDAPSGFATGILWPQYDAMGAVIARYLHGHAAALLTAWLGARD